MPRSVYTPWIRLGITPFEDEQFWAMPWREAEKFTRWFIDSIPQRLAALERFIRATPGFENWEADYTRESLVPLGKWFLGVIKTRPATAADIANQPPLQILNPDLPAEIIEDIRSWPSELRWVYVDETLACSVIVDLNTYLCECLRRAGPKSRWSRCRERGEMSEKAPVLILPSGMFYNPFWDALQYKMVEGRAPQVVMAEVYDEWRRHAEWTGPPMPEDRTLY